MKINVTDLEDMVKAIDSHDMPSAQVTSSKDGNIVVSILNLQKIKHAIQTAIDIQKGLRSWAEATTKTCPRSYLPTADQALLDVYYKLT